MSVPPVPLRQRDGFQWAMAAVLATTLAVGAHQGTFIGIDRSYDPKSGDLAALAEAKSVIDRRWVDRPEGPQLRDGAIQGMAATLDPFSAYIPPVETEEFERSTTGTFGGLGIWIQIDAGSIVVICPIEGTPAWNAGILPDDRIVRVNGTPCGFKSVEEASEALKGEIGTEVALAIQREGKPLELKVERAKIQIESVRGGRLLDPVSKIGYLRVTGFNSGTLEGVKKGVTALNEQGMRGLILDLRGNPGGLLDQAVHVANLWLEDDAVILSTWSRQQALERGDDRKEHGAEGDAFPASGYKHTVANATRLVTVPTVVLIDGGSASASEVLGGALQDNGKAKLVGTRSYGKGSVQSIISLQGGKAALKLTTQYYFTPKRRRIHRGSLPKTDLSWGLIPDETVEVPDALLAKLSRQEADYEMARLQAKARKVPFTGEDRLHREDPQARAGFVLLLKQLGDAVPAELTSTAPVDSGSAAPVESAATAPVESRTEGE